MLLWQDVHWILVRHLFKKATVEVEVIDAGNQRRIKSIDISAISESDLDSDFLAKLGLKPNRPNVEAIIGTVLDGSAANHAGLKVGDKVIGVDGVAITDWEALVSIIQTRPNQLIRLNIERADHPQVVDITPNSIDKAGKRVGQIGAGVLLDERSMASYLTTIHNSPSETLIKAFKKTWETALFSLKMLGNMLTGQVSIKSISGPVTIATYAGQSAHLGFNAFLAFLAVISISLGVLNLLPIPVLDGGHLLYYMVELVKGSPVSEQVMEIGQRIGFAVLGLLMVCALYNDINRLITG